MQPKLNHIPTYTRACPRCTGAVRIEGIPHEDEIALVCYACGWRTETVRNLRGRKSYNEYVIPVDASGMYA